MRRRSSRLDLRRGLAAVGLVLWAGAAIGCAARTAPPVGGAHVCPGTHRVLRLPPVTLRKLRGHVFVAHFESVAPIAGARVVVARNGKLIVERRTTVDGTFEFPDLRAGRYLLVICAEGYDSLETPLTLDAHGLEEPVELTTRPGV